MRQLREELENHFRPEFLNRLDAVVNFEHLTAAAIRKIFDLEAAKVGARIAARGITLDFHPDCVRFLIDNGASERSGARGIRHIIEDLVENRLSEMILQSQIVSGEKVRAVVEDGEVLIKVLEKTR